tara:strand:- start:11762 stop:12964 length:1203 start_codon:yes stop_codon:yes gene_type:complete
MNINKILETFTIQPHNINKFLNNINLYESNIYNILRYLNTYIINDVIKLKFSVYDVEDEISDYLKRINENKELIHKEISIFIKHFENLITTQIIEFDDYVEIKTILDNVEYYELIDFFQYILINIKVRILNKPVREFYTLVFVILYINTISVLRSIIKTDIYSKTKNIFNDEIDYDLRNNKILFSYFKLDINELELHMNNIILLMNFDKNEKDLLNKLINIYIKLQPQNIPDQKHNFFYNQLVIDEDGNFLKNNDLKKVMDQNNIILPKVSAFRKNDKKLKKTQSLNIQSTSKSLSSSPLNSIERCVSFRNKSTSHVSSVNRSPLLYSSFRRTNSDYSEDESLLSLRSPIILGSRMSEGSIGSFNSLYEDSLYGSGDSILEDGSPINHLKKPLISEVKKD